MSRQRRWPISWCSTTSALSAYAAQQGVKKAIRGTAAGLFCLLLCGWILWHGSSFLPERGDQPGAAGGGPGATAAKDDGINTKPMAKAS